MDREENGHQFPLIKDVYFNDKDEDPDIKKIYPSVRFWKRIRTISIGRFGFSHHYRVAEYDFTGRLYGIYSIGEIHKAIRRMNVNPFENE